MFLVIFRPDGRRPQLRVVASVEAKCWHHAVPRRHFESAQRHLTFTNGDQKFGTDCSRLHASVGGGFIRPDPILERKTSHSLPSR